VETIKQRNHLTPLPTHFILLQRPELLDEKTLIYFFITVIEQLNPWDSKNTISVGIYNTKVLISQV